LFDELRRLGFIEGRNLVVDAAGYGLPPERMEAHAADLMSGPVDVIIATGDPAVRAAQRATTNIPILAFSDDLVGLLVQTRGQHYGRFNPFIRT
jgi:putative ABC transport system substrate-binding protein